MHPLETILARAATGINGRPATIALSEGADPRVVRAAATAARDQIARIILVGAHDAVAKALAAADGAPDGAITIHDPKNSTLSEDFAKSLHELRKHKGMTPEIAQRAMRDPLTYAAMLVRTGHADGTVGGAVRTTADVVRTALQVIGKAPGTAMVSSFFLMVLDGSDTGPARTLIFSDCALVVDPDAKAMANIALASAQSFEALVGDTPLVAMLSFSTKGSARHARVTKVRKAVQIARAAHPNLSLDGELQFDAAFDARVATAKAPGSQVAGQANVFIFPNLDAGNIGYKIAQRIGGATAIGPVLQGLARPANDLSRGCTESDVLHMIGVTAVQAQVAAGPPA